MTQKPNWNLIKLAYQSKEGSLRDLAKRFDVSFHTLAKRCKRENWAGELAKLGDAVATAMATTAIQTATEQGEALGMTAVQFVERSILETTRWLDKIETLSNTTGLDVHKLKTLIDAWRAAISVGREAHRLDADEPVNGKLVVNLNFGPSPVRVIEVAEAKQIELDPASSNETQT